MIYLRGYIISILTGDYPAVVTSCSASSVFPPPSATTNYNCSKAFDGLAVTDVNEWSSHGEGVGAWIEATFDKVM